MRTTIVSIVVALALCSSCSQSNIVRDVPVRLVTPNQTMLLASDPTFDFDFHECLYCVDIGVTNDTILLLQDHIMDSDTGTFYKAYSLNDYSYLGAVLMKGRGANEVLGTIYNGDLISPKTKTAYCHIYDSALGKTFLLDLGKSLADEKTTLYKFTQLTGDIMYVYPYLDSLQYLSDIENNRICSHLIDTKGNKLKSVILYEDVPAMQNVSMLCCYNTINPEDGRIAMLMLSLPQVNILDFRTNEIKSVAVDKTYRRWRDIVYVKGPESITTSIAYYRGAISTPEYIIGLYKCQLRSNPAEADVHLHVFDWDGDFLYDLTVEEPLDWITYDKRTGYLYGLDKSAAEIYRYDLSAIL